MTVYREPGETMESLEFLERELERCKDKLESNKKTAEYYADQVEKADRIAMRSIWVALASLLSIPFLVGYLCHYRGRYVDTLQLLRANLDENCHDVAKHLESGERYECPKGATLELQRGDIAVCMCKRRAKVSDE